MKKRRVAPVRPVVVVSERRLVAAAGGVVKVDIPDKSSENDTLG